jgi:sugar lactone lactonase YvrE
MIARIFLVVSACLVAFPAGAQKAADFIYGQPNGYSNLPGNTAVEPEGRLYAPRGVAVDTDGVYISDYDRNRVLFFPHGSALATRVYGQPDFLSGVANYGGVSANSLSHPWGLAVDSEGLYVADYYNSRVLFFPKGSTTATRVYGQPDFASVTSNNGGVSANSLSYPEAVAVDVAGGLYVSDSANNRVLYYPPGSTTATFAYGQDSLDRNYSGGGIGQVAQSKGVAVDASGVYVTDYGNHRVLYFRFGERYASRVYGQPSFYSYLPNPGGIGPNTFQQPNGLAHDGTGLYVSDYLNSRILYFPGESTTATAVYGQTDFTTVRMNYGGVTPMGFYVPWGVATSADHVYGFDSYNARVIRWAKDNAPMPASAAFTRAPAGGNAGVPFSVQPEVTVRFTDGSTAESFNGTVTLRLKEGVGPTCARLLGETSVRAVDGVATFSNLAIDTPGRYQLVAFVATLPLPVTGAIEVSPAPGSPVAGDVDGNGALDMADVVTTLKVAAGLEAGR